MFTIFILFFFLNSFWMLLCRFDDWIFKCIHLTISSMCWEYVYRISIVCLFLLMRFLLLSFYLFCQLWLSLHYTFALCPWKNNRDEVVIVHLRHMNVVSPYEGMNCVSVSPLRIPVLLCDYYCDADEIILLLFNWTHRIDQYFYIPPADIKGSRSSLLFFDLWFSI